MRTSVPLLTEPRYLRVSRPVLKRFLPPSPLANTITHFLLCCFLLFFYSWLSSLEAYYWISCWMQLNVQLQLPCATTSAASRHFPGKSTFNPPGMSFSIFLSLSGFLIIFNDISFLSLSGVAGGDLAVMCHCSFTSWRLTGGSGPALLLIMADLIHTAASFLPLRFPVLGTSAF